MPVFPERVGGGGEPVPAMEWYPIHGGKQYKDWVLDVMEKRVHWPEKSPELQCKVFQSPIKLTLRVCLLLTPSP